MSLNTESLLNNSLDEDFKKMLMPYYFTQKLLFVSTYTIKNNSVFPISKVYCAFNFLAPCFVTYTYASISLATSCETLYLCPLVINSHFLFGLFVASACVIFKRQATVKILVRMQAIDKKLKSLGITNLNYFVSKNQCFVVFILVFYTSNILVAALNTHFFPWTDSIAWFLLIILDLNMLFSTFVVEFLSSRLKHFSSLFGIHNEIFLNICLEKNLNARLKNIFVIHKEILQAFTEASSIMQHSVLTNIISAFIDSLVTVHLLIECTKNAKNFRFYNNLSIVFVLLVVWYMKNLALVIMFSVTCERFYNRVNDTKIISATILELRPEQTQYQKTAKNILRMCDVRHSKMRVCGLFAVDAALPLRLAGLVATYTIVLLQFTFL